MIPGSFRPVLVLSLLLAVLRQCDPPPQETLVEFQDGSFLGALIDIGVDSDGDGEISYSEAEATRSIVLPPSGISNLAGLEAFIHLDSLSITLNPLDQIDLSANTSLRYLSCTSCGLAELDVSDNPALELLDCGRNLIKDLDVSKNASLITLVCNNNLLTSLDLSANTALKKMISCGNRLTRLVISNNTALKLIGFDNMPMLTEVCVWVLPFPPAGVTTLQEFSPNITFTDRCSGF